MTKEQMYLHLIAHAYIHDTLAGTGLRTLLDSYIFAGKYGNQDRFIHNRMERIMQDTDKPTKLKYIRKRLSYDQRNIENSPFYSKHPKPAPLLYVTRPIKAVLTRPKSVLKEIKQLNKRHKI